MARNDADILRSAATGDTEAFAELMARHGPRVRCLARALTGDDSDADDVTQETFIEAYKCAGRFDGRGDAVAWLLGIAANRCRMWGRRKGPSDVSLEALSNTPDGIEGDAQAAPHAQTELHELRTSIWCAVGGLPPEYRLPILLRFQQGLSYAEMAAALGISTNAAAVRLHRAKAFLRERLVDADGYLEGNAK